MDLIEIEVLAEAAVPDLEKEGLAEIQELVLLVVHVRIGVLAEILLARHAGARMDIFLLVGSGGSVGTAVSGALFGDEADKGIVQDFVGSLGVFVGCGILQDVGNVLARVLDDEATATGVIVDEVGHIVDFVADCYIAGVGGAMRLDLGSRKGRQRSGRHCAEIGVFGNAMGRVGLFGKGIATVPGARFRVAIGPARQSKQRSMCFFEMSTMQK